MRPAGFFSLLACWSVATLRSPPGRRRRFDASASPAHRFHRQWFLPIVAAARGPRLGSKRGPPSPADRQAPLAFCALTCTIMRNRFRARGSRRSAGAASETRSAPRDPIDALGGASCVVARGEPSEPSSGLFPTAGNRIGELFLRNGGLPDDHPKVLPPRKSTHVRDPPRRLPQVSSRATMARATSSCTSLTSMPRVSAASGSRNPWSSSWSPSATGVSRL